MVAKDSEAEKVKGYNFSYLRANMVQLFKDAKERECYLKQVKSE